MRWTYLQTTLKANKGGPDADWAVNFMKKHGIPARVSRSVYVDHVDIEVGEGYKSRAQKLLRPYWDL